ncbi:MAG: hypothetical protein IJ381_07175 [Clostridia bacterium]|nr:hypothetical protein [Clostridia bacterium]
MRKSDILAFGVPEERIKEFQAAYWADLHKVSRRLSAANTNQHQDTEARALLEAITAMLKLIDDPERLRMILSNVNRHFAQYTQVQREKQQIQEQQPLEE